MPQKEFSEQIHKEDIGEEGIEVDSSLQTSFDHLLGNDVIETEKFKPQVSIEKKRNLLSFLNGEFTPYPKYYYSKLNSASNSHSTASEGSSSESESECDLHLSSEYDTISTWSRENRSTEFATEDCSSQSTSEVRLSERAHSSLS